MADGCKKIADSQDGLVEDSDDELYNGMFLCRSYRKHFHLRTSRDRSALSGVASDKTQFDFE